MSGGGNSFLECLQGARVLRIQKGNTLQGPKGPEISSRQLHQGMMKRESQENGPQCSQRGHKAFSGQQQPSVIPEGKGKGADRGREGRSCRPGNWFGRVRPHE